MSPATLQQHPFLRVHLPHVQGSGRPSGFDVTISGTSTMPLRSKPKALAFKIVLALQNGDWIHSCY